MDNWPGMENDPDAQARIKKACDMLDAKDGMKILDIGCHKQEALAYLPPKAFYTGINDTVLVPGTVRMNIDGGFRLDQKADRILCLEVLEHLECPLGTLEAIQSVLQDDGVLVVSLPNEATLFHRIRCLLGIVDQECFVYGGKHLHLPSLSQSRAFLRKEFQIVEEAYYISHCALGTRQEIVANLIRVLPKQFLELLANVLPSLFARGFIFKLKKKLP